MIQINSAKHIVWIASYPRSGNTWARAFLFSLYNVFRNEALSSLDFRLLDGFAVPDTALALFKKHLRFPPTLVDRKTIAALRPTVMKEVAAATKGVVLLKTHSARIEDNGTPFIDDSLTAGAVYLVRNPLDVAVSFATLRRIPVDEAIRDMASRGFGRNSTASSVYSVHDSWSGNVRSWLDRSDPATLAVRYEDMRDNPLATFAGIAGHMLMRPSPEQLKKAIDLITIDKGAVQAGAPGAEEQWGVMASAGARWQDVLSPAQIRQIVADHGRLMARFGYLP